MMGEEETVAPILTLFSDFNASIERLEKIPALAQKKCEELTGLFFRKKETDKDIFEEPEKFLNALGGLLEEVGHANHTVLEIELKRQGITSDSEMAKNMMNVLAEKNTQNRQPGSPTIIQPNSPQQLGVLSGLWYYKAAKEIAKASTAQKEFALTPQISTSKQVVDILDFGRQLIPELNRVQEFYQRSLHRIECGFDDAVTRGQLSDELRKHLNKLSGIIRSFARTITEYRTELIGERKKEVAEAIIAMKMAEYTNLGGTKVQELYRQLREASGAQNASGD